MRRAGRWAASLAFNGSLTDAIQASRPFIGDHP